MFLPFFTKFNNFFGYKNSLVRSAESYCSTSCKNVTYNLIVKSSSEGNKKLRKNTFSPFQRIHFFENTWCRKICNFSISTLEERALVLVNIVANINLAHGTSSHLPFTCHVMIKCIAGTGLQNLSASIFDLVGTISSFIELTILDSWRFSKIEKK